MKQIYDFHRAAPPVLTEAMLRQRQAQRRQTWLLGLAGLLSQLCVLLLAVLAMPQNEEISFLFLSYFVISVSGWVILALVFVKKRRFLSQ